MSMMKFPNQDISYNDGKCFREAYNSNLFLPICTFKKEGQ